jgi:hypothetical protein
MEREKFFNTSLLLKVLKEHEKCVFMVCGRGRCPWFWAEVAVKAWRNLATLLRSRSMGESPSMRMEDYLERFLRSRSRVNSRVVNRLT